MKHITKIFLFAIVGLFFQCQQNTERVTKTAESGGYTYEYVTNDPLKVRIYTLKNGLKVYLSKYDAEPRIYTSIAVKAGGKFDPPSTTGLAHYLEHIMFKGTSDFGTMDWEKEKILLDSIERMFEHYRTLTDAKERLAYYKKIDQVSNEASQYAIANEYDKMIAEMGGQGTNAYTTEDRTVYINDIPSNQIEKWILLEANRFREIVPRLFHTELESVYEEKNRSLDNDNWKAYETLYAQLFKTHPYGTQTVIGTINHLKNPSITEIKNYFYKYYRPNNVAICLSGDLDYDQMIAKIDEAFGSWEPNDALKEWNPIKEDPITEPRKVDVYGPQSEFLYMGFTFEGTQRNRDLVRLTDMILSNSQAGLIDLNLKQQQKVLEASCFVVDNNDYFVHIFYGNPREGQTLESLQELLLEQIELVKAGEFEDWLMDATINDMKKSDLERYQQNRSRSDAQVMAFTTNTPWVDYVSSVDNLRKYTKEDVINFVKEHYQDNYGVVYKRNGEDSNKQQVEKPPITKVVLNKEARSPFHDEVLALPATKIQPVFVDYKNDIRKHELKQGVELLYSPNSENDLFELYYYVDMGTDNNPMMKDAVEYIQYIGTSDMSAADIKKEFYKLGCAFSVGAYSDQTYIQLSGINENMDKAIVLLEKLLSDPVKDDEELSKMIEGILRTREDMKKNKRTILVRGLLNYGLYGSKNSFTNVLTNKEVQSLKAEELIDILKGITQYEHKVLYYGPRAESEILKTLSTLHNIPDQLTPVPARVDFPMQDMKNPMVYWADYDMVQAEILFLSKGDTYAAERVPVERVFNEYFGGSMSSPVFQELREAQGLAYSAFARYSEAKRASDSDFFFAYIGTQADKQPEAMKAMQGLIQNFPRSEAGFEIARKSVMNNLESERILRADLIFNYLDAQRLGLDHDVRKDVYDQLQNMTIEDLENFQNQNIAGRPSNVVLVGSRDKLNLRDLAKYGTVRELTLDEIFGYEQPIKVGKDGL